MSQRKFHEGGILLDPFTLQKVTLRMGYSKPPSINLIETHVAVRRNI